MLDREQPELPIDPDADSSHARALIDEEEAILRAGRDGLQPLKRIRTTGSTTKSLVFPTFTLALQEPTTQAKFNPPKISHT